MKSLLPLQLLALPLTCAQLAFSLNTFVTNWFLARASAEAFHAALPGSMLAVAVSALAISTLGYSGTILARRHGHGDDVGACATFHAALLLTLCTLPYFVLAAPVGHFVLGLFNAKPNVLAAEVAYYDILLANGFFTVLAAVLGGSFTGQGRTHLVGAVTVCGFAANMLLAPLFIGGHLGLPVHGIVGAGWAATLAHILPCLVLGAVRARHPIARGPVRVTRHDALEILRLGLPNGVRSLVDIGGFFAFTAVLAECPSAAVAASTAAFAVNGVYQAFPQGLAQALEVKVARTANRLLPTAFILTALYAGVFGLVLLLGGQTLLAGFRPAGDDAFLRLFGETARPLILILGVKALFESAVQILQADLRGRHRTLTVFRIQFGSSLLFWVPLFLTVRALHPTIPALWLTMVACSALSTFLLARQTA